MAGLTQFIISVPHEATLDQLELYMQKAVGWVVKDASAGWHMPDTILAEIDGVVRRLAHLQTDAPPDVLIELHADWVEKYSLPWIMVAAQEWWPREWNPAYDPEDPASPQTIIRPGAVGKPVGAEILPYLPPRPIIDPVAGEQTGTEPVTLDMLRNGTVRLHKFGGDDWVIEGA